MITVGICTRNRAPDLRQTLDGFCDLAPQPPWELIVCGNDCTDDSEAVTNSFADRLPIRFAPEPKVGLSMARNRVLAEARGDIVAFADDDVNVAPGWLQALDDGGEAFPEAGVFGGPIVPVFPAGTDPGILAVLPSIRRGFAGLDFGPSPRRLDFPEYPFGANMAFRRSAVAGVTFDPALGYRGKSLVPGEERDFVGRIVAKGWTIQWLPGMALQHRIAANRLTVSYLSRLTRDYTTLAAQERPVPDGPRVAGVPRWLVRRYASLRAQAALARIRGSASEYLSLCLEAARVRGEITGVRMRHRQGGDGAS